MHHIQRSNWDLCQARSALLPVQKDTGHFAICPAAVRGWAIATLTLAVAPRLVSRVIAKGAHITILFVFKDCPHWRRRRSRWRWSRWSRWRRRRWSRWRRWRSRRRCTTALHPNICAVYELLPLVVAHGLSRIAARKAGKISVEATGAPPSRFQLVPVAAVVLGRHATVRCPPTPLESALRATQTGGDAIAEFVGSATALRRQIKAFWMESVHWLAIRAGVVGTAISGRSHSLQAPSAQTGISPH